MENEDRPIPKIFEEPPDPSVEALITAMQHEAPSAPPSGVNVAAHEVRMYDKRATEFWERAFTRGKYTLDELLPQRTLLAWRFTREIIRANGIIGADEPLSAMRPEAWFEAMESTEVGRGRYPEIEQAEQAIDGLGLRVHADTVQEVEQKGLSLTPPPIPLSYLEEDGRPFRGYDPHDDRLLKQWLGMLRRISDTLMLGIGGRDLPHIDEMGLAQMLDHDRARQAWPSVLQIISLETMLVEETLRLLVEESLAQTMRELKQDYNFSTVECNELIKLARACALEVSEGDIDEDRSLMVMRLESFVKRARDSIDLRAELAGLKQLALIQGLSRSDLDNPMKDIIEIITEGSRERKQKRIDNLAKTSGELPEGLTTPSGHEIVGTQGEVIT